MITITKRKLLLRQCFPDNKKKNFVLESYQGHLNKQLKGKGPHKEEAQESGQAKAGKA